MMQTVLTLVAAERGVSIVPACVRNLRADGVRFYRFLPDDVRVELVAAWKKDNITAPVRAFLDLTDAKAPMIRKKAVKFADRIRVSIDRPPGCSSR